ncbi:MAG: DEAD/DEAH box helicase [Chryseobacterium jejuense]|uniref:DEAD/DEAH box helicase n=1 Tax=Chryseobacterium jejuense TaxID=445960 RepID=UPI003D14ED99
MSIENNQNRLDIINEDKTIQNLIAQANARYILFNTAEDKDNFPTYTIKDQNLNILAFYYLDIGCVFGENENLESAREPLEKGASILEYVHGSENNKSKFSNYYGLIAAMAHYVSFQYSKSYILIGKIESESLIAKMISLFLKRNFSGLINTVERVILDETYQDEYIAKNQADTEDGADKIYTLIIARSLDGFIKYFQTGDEEILMSAKTNLRLLKEIAELKKEPSIWWVIRLLILISDGFNQASLWKALDSFFNVQSDIVQKYIKSLVYLFPRGIHELFITQRKALSKVLSINDNGCVVTIPTSSGKTRIAEIAILDSIIRDPHGKILYIAPFRSLAFEIENDLEKILGNVGIITSHLYGGSLFSKMDEIIIEESNVIIATPEKAKAIIRGNRDIANQLRLVIIDEGHLLGANQRLIMNEVFFEELRYFVKNNKGKFLLLSAVLPNAEDLAHWLTGNENSLYKDTWRSADERLGILEWTNNQINLHWLGSSQEHSSFNNRFIIQEELPLKPKQRRIHFFPEGKNEAISATAYKLRSFGTVLLFVGIKSSVFTMANTYLKCLEINADTESYMDTSSMDWKTFELACIETYGENNLWLKFAEKGILCHHGALHADVRLPMERLMRNGKPRVIIATTTLGQGVNLGVSTVIFTTLYQAGQLISKRDFWNIAGRAGRAFIDHEAKILVAFDKSNISTKKDRWKNEKFQEEIMDYFNKEHIDIASSGILILVRSLKQITKDNDIDFEFLLELISENRLEDLNEKINGVENVLDWIDDTLLALHSLYNDDIEDNSDYEWIELFFRDSLAFIQLKKTDNLSEHEFISFIKARVRGIVNRIGTNHDKWKSIINSGIPLNSDLFLEDKLFEILHILKEYENDTENISLKINIIQKIVKTIQDVPILEENNHELTDDDFDNITSLWINGEAMSLLMQFDQSEKIISEIFSYKLPWIFNGIAKKLKNLDLEDEAELIEELALLIEIGLPTLNAIKIYQAGIRSRIYANEMSDFFEDSGWEKSIKDYRIEILSNKEFFKNKVSQKCSEWIDILSHASNFKSLEINKIPDFQLEGANKSTTILIAKQIDEKQYLRSPDFSFIHDDSEGDIDFSEVNHLSGVIFIYDKNEDVWKMKIENPYIIVKSE